MSTDSKRKPFVVPMRGRLPDEVHRASTPLELLFDLVFVVAVALASARLHHRHCRASRCARRFVVCDGIFCDLVGVDEFFMVCLGV